MASISRVPRPELRPFVQRRWASDTAVAASPMERVLPTGTMHLVIRLSGGPLVLFDDASGAKRRNVGHAVVGGARSTHYVRSIAEPARSVGAQLLPGAGPTVVGVPASELAERHTPLDEVWGRHALDARERLLHAGQDHFYGERSGAIRDPFGHEWLVGHEIEKVTPEEMQRRYDEVMKAG